MIIHRVLPAIKRMWPERNREILIQQDGASSHILGDDFEFQQHASTGNWNIKLVQQPAKSPDLNVLDLSFFRALQSEQWKRGFVTTAPQLIHQVLGAFADFDPRKIDFGFLTLQQCMDDILLNDGGNDYALKHMGKQTLLAAGELPERIEMSDDAIERFRFWTNMEDDNEEERRHDDMQMIQPQQVEQV